MLFNPERFPRLERIRSSAEFSAIYTGKRVSGSMFIIYYVTSNCGRKVGFTVSKKVSKSAVKRNKLKRRLKEIYRLNKNLLPENLSLVIRSLPQAAGVNFNAVKNEIITLFKIIASKNDSYNVNNGV